MLLQIQNIELHALSQVSHMETATSSNYPTSIIVTLQGPYCNAVRLGDHIHVSGNCIKTARLSGQGLAQLSIADLHVSISASQPCQPSDYLKLSSQSMLLPAAMR